MKKLSINNLELSFREVKLYQFKNNLENIFKDYKSKTISETINSKKYKNLKSVIENENDIKMPTGEFLLKLKNNGNKNYLSFLNNYGDKVYSHFGISENEVFSKKGIYTYYLNDKIKYIGITKDNYQKRINNGYGNISPKNCFKDGQTTNCHLNWLISSSFNNIKFYVKVMDNIDQIMSIEKKLIQKYDPPWNIQLKNKT